jgi:DNA-directed RNA polymerase subunit RPC12/RpoP
MLLPYDCVKEFLEHHPLVCISAISPHAIHECLVEMFDVPFVPYDCKRNIPVIGLCPDCKSKRELDARNSVLVCTSCGMVENYCNPSNCVVFDKDPSSPSVSKANAKNDIPHWLKKASQFDEGEYQQYEIDKEMEQWNSYKPGGTHLSEDDMAASKKRALIPRRASKTARCLAALFYPHVKNTLALDEIEKTVKSGGVLPTLADPEDPNTKQWGVLHCLKCHAIVRTPYEQKRHACGWGRKKRRRVSI